MLCRGPDRRGEIYTSLLDNIGIMLEVKYSMALRLFFVYFSVIIIFIINYSFKEFPLISIEEKYDLVMQILTCLIAYL